MYWFGLLNQLLYISFMEEKESRNEVNDRLTEDKRYTYADYQG